MKALKYFLITNLIFLCCLAQAQVKTDFNNEAVISAPWSMHFGVGTYNYGFIWGMAGENKEFTDMDQVSIASIK